MPPPSPPSILGPQSENIPFYPRPADSIGHSVRPSVRQRRQGHRPHDDDEEEEDNEVEDNDNNKEDKNDKGISSLGPPRKHTVQQ